jgi:hypothetical protein
VNEEWKVNGRMGGKIRRWQAKVKSSAAQAPLTLAPKCAFVLCASGSVSCLGCVWPWDLLLGGQVAAGCANGVNGL